MNESSICQNKKETLPKEVASNRLSTRKKINKSRRRTKTGLTKNSAPVAKLKEKSNQPKKEINQPEGIDCNKDDGVLHLGDGLLMQKETTSTSNMKAETIQKQSISLQIIDFKCNIIRNHHRECSCTTPRLHVYLVNKHQCDSTCKLDSADAIVSIATSNNDKVTDRIGKQCDSEPFEDSITESDLAHEVQEEQIIMPDSQNSLSCQSKRDDSDQQKQKLQTGKKSQLKIKRSLFQIKKVVSTSLSKEFDKKPPACSKGTKLQNKTRVFPVPTKTQYSKENILNTKLTAAVSLKRLKYTGKDKENSSNKVTHIDPPKKTRRKIETSFRALPVTKRVSNEMSDQPLPKKGKKLFQINKEGVFHSFSQNMIKISSVSSLNSSAEKADEISLDKSTVSHKTKHKTKQMSDELIPPLKICMLRPFPDDATAEFISKLTEGEEVIPPSTFHEISDGNGLETAQQQSSQSTQIEYLSKIKTEPPSLVNIKSETIIDECLNVMMDEEESLVDDDLKNIRNSLTLEEKKPDELSFPNTDKYPQFGGTINMNCSLCFLPFNDFLTLADHLEKHQREGFILCYYCQKSFGDKTSMKRHMRTHTGEKPYQCKICHKRFSLPGNFKKHRDIHEDIRTEPCDICGKTFRRKEHLKYHKRTHTGERPFKCKLCGSCFTARYSLHIHMNIHLGRRPYKCSYCGKTFCDKSTMRKHIRVHTGERPFSCPDCPKSFGESGTLAAHAATHSQDRPFICSQCHLAFKTSGGLRQHIKTHVGDKQYSCKYCGMMFIQKYNMTMHERIHTGEKPYQCSECNRTFRSRSCLGKHIILHGGDAEKKYSCDHCDKKFFRKAHLKRHIQTHLGIKEYDCTFCTKKFCTKGSLKKHLVTFHTEGARAFPCFLCGKVFKRSIYVTTHKCITSFIKAEPES